MSAPIGYFCNNLADANVMTVESCFSFRVLLFFRGQTMAHTITLEASLIAIVMNRPVIRLFVEVGL